jgi:hypothetical protein
MANKRAGRLNAADPDRQLRLARAWKKGGKPALRAELQKVQATPTPGPRASPRRPNGSWKCTRIGSLFPSIRRPAILSPPLIHGSRSRRHPPEGRLTFPALTRWNGKLLHRVALLPAYAQNAARAIARSFSG